MDISFSSRFTLWYSFVSSETVSIKKVFLRLAGILVVKYATPQCSLEAAKLLAHFRVGFKSLAGPHLQIRIIN